VPTPQAQHPTATPPIQSPPAAILPAPIYLLDDGQVVRIEADAVTRTTITRERPFTEGAPAIAELAVSPADGALAYTLLGESANTLVTTDADGQGRRVLLEGVRLAGLRWSTDGSALALQIVVPLGADSPLEPGIWVVSAASGEARLLIANDQPTPEHVGEAWTYVPDAWSPDGTRLLISRTSHADVRCEAAILDVATGELTELLIPQGAMTSFSAQCSGGVWEADSTSVLVVIRGAGPVPPAPGLYRADAISGELTEVVPETTRQNQIILAQSHSVSPEGRIYLLAAVVDALPNMAPDPGDAPPARLYATQPGGELELVSDAAFQLYGTALWAPDLLGVLIPTLTDSGGVIYRYAPLQGNAVGVDLEQGPTTSIAWGR
jgi:hypothetical protein